MSRKSRHGVSLLEIIVVLAALMLLAAALIPAVFRVRQAASRSQSQNNLKQITLAMHNYHDSFNALPLVVGNDPSGRHGTIFFHLLPFIEQTPLHQRGDVWRSGGIGTPVPVYLDPRDPSGPPNNKYDDWLATTNYAANWLAFGKPGNFAAFTDGLSNTIAFTERYQVCNDHPCAWAYDRIYYWAPMTGYYSQAKFQPAPKQADCDPRLAQSLDPDAIQTALADGSVRRVRYSVSSQTWYHALHPSDGQPLGADWND